MNKSRINYDRKIGHLPDWLCPNSTVVAPLYKKIWEAVKENQTISNTTCSELLVNTNKIFPLLLTSQLPTEVLGYIWSLANQKYAGQLTEQELYIVLALVALAQSSYLFNKLEILNTISFPPLPNLDLTSIELNCLKDETNGLVDSPIINRKYNRIVKLNNRLVDSVTGNVHISPTCNQNLSSEAMEQRTSLNVLYGKELSMNNQSNTSTSSFYSTANSNDDFSEFQCASIINMPSNTNVIDSKQGSAIGSRLANHNLGVKRMNDKLKKLSINKNHSNYIYDTLSNSHLLSNYQIQSNDCLSEIFPKCVINGQAKTVILKDTAIRNNDHIEKDKFIANDLNLIKIQESKLSNVNDLDNIVTFKKSLVDKSQKDLMNVHPNEDKYSALRSLINDQSIATNVKINLESSNVHKLTEDFGDFVSAEQFDDTTNKKCNPSLFQDTSNNLNSLSFEQMLDKQNNDKLYAAFDIAAILTRCRSVPNLDLNAVESYNQEDTQQIDNIHQIIYWEWNQFLQRCIFLLQMAVTEFMSISSESVLKEVLLSAHGYNFLCNLAEVAAICRRINFSYKEMDISIIGFNDLLLNIDRIWSEMEPFYTNIPIITELPSRSANEDDGSSCAICLTIISNCGIIHNNNHYHSSCANLWFHTVNHRLPVLQYPESRMQSVLLECSSDV